MQPRLSSQRNAGITRIEVFICVVSIISLLFLGACASEKSRVVDQSICCSCNLATIGTSFRIWEDDHNDRSPMQTASANGGAMESVERGEVATVFQVMSNELSDTSLLICPLDTGRITAVNFTSLTNSNISYFLNIDVTNAADPQMILSGDSNLKIGEVPAGRGLLLFDTNNPVQWTANRHVNRGHIAHADGSVDFLSNAHLVEYQQNIAETTNRFAIP